MTASPSISSASVVRPSDIPLITEEKLNRIVAVFKLVLKENLTLGEKQVSCFKAVFADCRENQWARISELGDALLGLRDKRNRTLLFRMLEQGNQEVLNKAVEKKLAVNLASGEFNETLHTIIRMGRTDVFTLFLRAISINQLDAEGKTLLHVAIETGQPKMVRALIDNGCSLDITYKTLSPLAWCVARGEAACFDVLRNELREKVWRESVPSVGNLLHVAIHFGQSALLRILVTTHHKDVKDLINQRNNAGLTPLMLAALSENHEAVQTLNEAKAILDFQDPKGWTALHHAASKGFLKIIELLLLAGAKSDIPDITHNRPLDVAAADSKTLISNAMAQCKRGELKPPNFKRHHPKNLVFKGGGTKGIAYVGVIESLNKLNAMNDVERYGGTSAGAITAALLAMGKTSGEIQSLLEEMNPLTKFLDYDNLFLGDAKTVVGKMFRVINMILDPIKLIQALCSFTGLCKGEFFREWMEREIEKATGIKECTMGELSALVAQGRRSPLGVPLKHLHVFATRIGEHPKIFVLSSEDDQWKDLIVSDAVRASMSFPGVFKPHQLHFKIKDIRTLVDYGSFVDGGMLFNFPLEAFDYRGFIERGLKKDEATYPVYNRHTLGFNLYTPGKIEPHELERVENIKDLLCGIIDAYNHAESLIRQRNPYNLQRTVDISNEGIGALNFDLSNEQQQLLIKSGQEATLHFFGDEPVGEVDDSLFEVTAPTKKGLVNIPDQPKNFQGRAAILSNLNLLQLPAWHGLYGDEGIGKSALACQFAYTHREKFSLIAWIDCETAESRAYSYQALAKELKIDLNLSYDLLVVQVNAKLENYPTDRPWLLILDNLQAPQPWPIKGGLVLCTMSKQEPWTLGKAFAHLSSLSQKENIALLSPLSAPAYDDLAEKFRSSPLALQLAKAYMKKKGITCADYNQLHTTLKPLEKAWKLSSAYLDKEQLACLNVCAHFYPRFIPADLLKKHGPVLQELQLVNYDEETKAYSLMPSLRKLILANADEVSYQKAIVFIQQEKKPASLLWLLHASALVKDQSNLWFNVGRLREQFIGPKLALEAYEQALPGLVDDDDDLAQTKCHFKMARCALLLNNHLKATMHATRAEAKYAANNPHSHPHAKALVLLGTCKMPTHLAEARTALEAALKINEMLHTKAPYPKVTTNLALLANVLERLNLYPLAIHAYDKIITIYKARGHADVPLKAIIAAYLGKGDCQKLNENNDAAKVSYNELLVILRKNRSDAADIATVESRLSSLEKCSLM